MPTSGWRWWAPWYPSKHFFWQMIVFAVLAVGLYILWGQLARARPVGSDTARPPSPAQRRWDLLPSESHRGHPRPVNRHEGEDRGENRPNSACVHWMSIRKPPYQFRQGECGTPEGFRL